MFCFRLFSIGCFGYFVLTRYFISMFFSSVVVIVPIPSYRTYSHADNRLCMQNLTSVFPTSTPLPPNPTVPTYLYIHSPWYFRPTVQVDCFGIHRHHCNFPRRRCFSQHHRCSTSQPPEVGASAGNRKSTHVASSNPSVLILD